MIDGIDKVTVTCHYDDSGRARTIFVYLNADDLTADDVSAAVRAVFRPDRTNWNDLTRSNPQVRVNGSDINGNGKPGWL